MSIDNTLNERGARYGDFTDHARICQTLKAVMMDEPGWDRLGDVHKQALEVIADKIARILSGDPNYADNWHDIQGYAKLVEDRLGLFSKQPQKTAEEIERVGVEKAIKSLDAEIEAKLPGRKINIAAAMKYMERDLADRLGKVVEAPNTTEDDTCDCPACTLRRTLMQALGGDVEVEIMRFDPDLGKTGPVKH